MSRVIITIAEYMGVVINSVSIDLRSIAQAVPEIMIFRILTGIAHAFFWPPCESIISNQSFGQGKNKRVISKTRK